ncbi:hypothetical protein TI04_07415 [Achromatium sp. WMS2]|nr:hypothetical protein TI04_07415 [Achromatium sp. WMS2]
MGLGGISFFQLLVILVIIVLLFGTNRLRNLGSDLGEAIKGFRNAMHDGEKEHNVGTSGSATKTNDNEPGGNIGRS